MRPSGMALLRCRGGFTYLMAMMIVMVMGIALARAGHSWQHLMQQEKEEELIFRGSQIQDALTRWHRPAAGGHVVTPLTDLKQLLKDPRTAGTVRHLRRLYRDPMTGSEWELITDPVRGITGVNSKSEQKPFKTDNFPEQIKGLINKKSYREWQFVVQTTAAPAAGQDLKPEPIGISPVSGLQ